MYQPPGARPLRNTDSRLDITTHLASDLVIIYKCLYQSKNNRNEWTPTIPRFRFPLAQAMYAPTTRRRPHHPWGWGRPPGGAREPLLSLVIGYFLSTKNININWDIINKNINKLWNWKELSKNLETLDRRVRKEDQEHQEGRACNLSIGELKVSDSWVPAVRK